MGLLFFLFFIGPWFLLGAWIWRETGGLTASRHALLGTLGPEHMQPRAAAATTAAPPPAASASPPSAASAPAPAASPPPPAA